jgi:hypothetical protein
MIIEKVKKMDLTTIFGKYAGLEVTHSSGRVADNDPVIADMEKTAEDNGLRLRVFTPEYMVGTADFCLNRVNVRLGYDDNNRLVVPDVTTFNLG